MRPSRRPSVALTGFLAWRMLAQSPIATTVMILAVAVGVAFQIPNTANLAGYKREILRQGVDAGFGDVRVRPQRGRYMHDARVLVTELAARPNVTAAVPVITVAGAIGADRSFEDAFIIGVDSNAPRRPYHLLRGTSLPPADTGGLILGSALARRAGVDVGDSVQLRLILTSGVDLTSEDTVGRYTMVVRGIAAGGFVAPSAVVLDRGFLGTELGLTDGASVILLYANDHDAADALAAAIAKTRPDLRAIAWGDDNPFLDAAVSSSGTIASVSYAMVMIAIIIPVWALLYISVLHRQRHVALMSAIGFGRVSIFFVFLVQAIIIGLLGIILGCIGGYALVRYFDASPIFAMESFVITPTRTLRTYVEPALLILMATIVAGVWPAMRASRSQPSRILRAGR